MSALDLSLFTSRDEGRCRRAWGQDQKNVVWMVACPRMSVGKRLSG